MNTDVMHLLRAADPVASEPHYDDAEARLRIDAILGATTMPDPRDTTVIALVDRPADVARRRWVMALGAVASVTVLAGTGLTIAHERDTAGAGRGGSAVSCRVTGIASTARLAAARTVITDRVAAAGGHAASFRLDGRIIHFTARGVDTRTATAACAATTAALRPLVTAPVPANATGAHSATPLAGLGFGVPRSATQLAALSPSQRARLTTAIARYDCSAAGSVHPAEPALACGPSAGRRSVYLLGPAVVTSSGISSAVAQAPSVTGDVRWDVRLDFTPGAQAAVTDYTQHHHSMRDRGTATTCSATTSPCADFLAYAINNRMESAPQVNSAIMGEMVTNGGFDRSSATTLADDITAAAVGLTPATR